LYGKVAVTGESARFVEVSEAMGRWFDSYAFRIGGEESKRVAILFTDITEKKRTEEAIQQSESNLRNIILQSPVAMVIMTGPSFVVTVANERLLELWGKREEEMMNKPLFEGIPEAREQGLEQLLQHVYTTGETVEANEHPVTLLRNGKAETVYINFVYEPFKALDGTIAGWMSGSN
jgi:PAS domain S-box-containing protein